MKKDTIHNTNSECGKTSCTSCERCSLVNFEEVRPEIKDRAAQLYATEAEHYFFYFAKDADRKVV
jgi:hypothetical protein